MGSMADRACEELSVYTSSVLLVYIYTKNVTPGNKTLGSHLNNLLRFCHNVNKAGAWVHLTLHVIKNIMILSKYVDKYICNTACRHALATQTNCSQLSVYSMFYTDIV